MSHGPSHPDDETKDLATDSAEEGPFGTLGAGQATEATLPPSVAFRPAAGDIPSSAFEPTQKSQHSYTPAPTPSGEHSDSIGIQGPPQPGQVLFGRYLAEKLLGEGGMGTVWLVKHLELDTLRALKLIVSGIAFDPNAQARFKREARVMARLSHPNAVVVHDARMGRDAAFIEMEFIRGQSLNRLMSQGVAMPLAWTARILDQLCDVLDEAHRQKIVHRDLKPANLMLLEGRPVGKEQLKVLDFGIAKILGSEEGMDIHTHTGCFLGSAPYTSPEQASGTEIDGRSDLYSVGVILYELLTGHRPFTGPITRLIYDHLYTAPPPFRERNPSARVPADVERVVQRCLAKNPAERPQTARDLIDEFLSALPEGYEDDDRSMISSPTEPDPGAGHVPRTIASSWTPGYEDPLESRTRGLVEDTEKVPEHLTQAPPSGYPPPPKPAYAPPIGSTYWGDEPIAPAKLDPASARRRRRVRVLIGLFGVVAIGGLSAIAGLLLRRPAAPGPPAGYEPAQAGDLVAGYPRVLVRTSDKTRFLRIEGGKFKMGNDFDKSATEKDDDQPAHPVELSDFYIQETEVTNAEMEAYFRANHIDVKDRPKRWKAACAKIDKEGQAPDRFPAVGISHELAEAYARWAGGRLPTEAQWEYAARSRGQPNPFVWGTEPKPDSSRANVETVGYIGAIPTKAVGSYPKDRTSEGVLDLTGNVREWCRDVWSPYVGSADPVRDPQGPAPSQGGPDPFVIRGGSFLYRKDRVRTTRPRRPDQDDDTALQLAQDGTALDLGFRVVLEWPKR